MQCKRFINAKIRRVKYKYGKIERIEIPWSESGKRYTKLFEICVIEWLLGTKNQTKTAQILRCDFNVVNKIMHNATKRGLKRRDVNEVYKPLNIDEK